MWVGGQAGGPHTPTNMVRGLGLVPGPRFLLTIHVLCEEAMTPNEVTAILRQFIDWRRDTSNWPPSPALVEEAIDAAIEMIDRLEAAENDAAHQKALAESALSVVEGWEGKCDALRATVRHKADCVEAAKAEIESLRAKIEQMEKQEPACWTTQLALELGSSALGFDACRGNL